MIVVNAVVETNPENIDAIRDAVAAMEKASLAEDGCHDYTFSVELNKPNTLRVFEKWESMDHLEAHFIAPHMETFREVMDANQPMVVTAEFYEATEVIPEGYAS